MNMDSKINEYDIKFRPTGTMYGYKHVDKTDFCIRYEMVGDTYTEEFYFINSHKDDVDFSRHRLNNKIFKITKG